MKKVLLAGACLLGLGLPPMAAQATSIQLGINGDALGGANAFDFRQYPQPAPDTSAPGYGTFQVSLMKAGPFTAAGVIPGEFGHIQSLTEGDGAVTLPGQFMTFDRGEGVAAIESSALALYTPFSATFTANLSAATESVSWLMMIVGFFGLGASLRCAKRRGLALLPGG